MNMNKFGNTIQKLNKMLIYFKMKINTEIARVLKENSLSKDVEVNNCSIRKYH